MGTRRGKLKSSSKHSSKFALAFFNVDEWNTVANPREELTMTFRYSHNFKTDEAKSLRFKCVDVWTSFDTHKGAKPNDVCSGRKFNDDVQGGNIIEAGGYAIEKLPGNRLKVSVTEKLKALSTKFLVMEVFHKRLPAAAIKAEHLEM